MKFYKNHPHGNKPAIEATDLSKTQITDAIGLVTDAAMHGTQSGFEELSDVKNGSSIHPTCRFI